MMRGRRVPLYCERGTTMSKTAFRLAPVAALALVAAPAFATPGTGADYSTLTAAVDWSTAITGMMAVAAVVAGVLVVRKGIRFVLGMIK